MSYIVTESTSIIQVDTSGLQNGNYTTVYLSTTTIPGQLVTVMDATGFLSSPQSILLRAVGGATFSNVGTSILLTQRYSYITLVSEGTNIWAPVNQAPFQNPSSLVICKALDAVNVTTQALAADLISTASLSLQSIETRSTLNAGPVVASTLYLNTYSRYVSSSPLDYRFTVNGAAYISAAVNLTGAGFFRGSIDTNGNCFNTGNISSKLGTIYVGGDVTTASSIRGQRGTVIDVIGLSSFASAGFVGAVTIGSNTQSGGFVNANAITTTQTQGNSVNIFSSLTFSRTQSIQNSKLFQFVNMPITISSSVNSLSLVASNSLATSNLILQSFQSTSAMSYIRLGSTVVENPAGSLTISSILGNTFKSQEVTSKQSQAAGLLVVNSITMNTQSTSSVASISYPDGTLQVPLYWVISSLSTNGTFNAPNTAVSTNTLIGQSITAKNLDTVEVNFRNFYSETVIARSNVLLSSVNAMSIKGARINNLGGSITGNVTETMQTVYTSSIKTDTITAPLIRFTQPNRFSLPTAYISSLNAGTVLTSSLTVPKIITGSSGQYSTINPSTAFLEISSFQMNTEPFNVTTGLGTYFDQVTFVGTQTQTAYYTIVDPQAQPTYLSTPYVNTVSGTGIPGMINQIASNSQIGFIAGQPTSDSAYNLYIGSGYNGWRVQKISPSGQITTLAGNNQYFYGDGQFSLSAAFGPKLAVSIYTPGTALITDISNSRIRYVTSDPIVTTIAGTGIESYTGDGGLAFNATLSTPTTTVTDSLGNTYIADTGNQVIRRIQNSTITTYGGTGQIGNTGDNGPAINATMNSPYGLAVDSANNLLFTDLSNCAIRRIGTDGIIRRVAGTYTRGFSGDGGPASNATLAFPRDVAVDSANNIYFCDTGNSRVRRIDAATNIIRTVAGTGTQGYSGDNGLALLANLSSPTGIAVDTTGNLYIADTNNQCIRYVNMTTSTITTVAGRPRTAGYGGDRSFATFALLNSPSHIAFDPSSGYYYIGDDGNRRIRYVNSATKIIFTYAGNGSPFTAGDGGAAVNAVFGSITSVVADANQNIYISDGLGNAIRRIDAVTSTITTVAGGVAGFSGDGGLATAANLSSPQTLLIDSSRNLYFTDTNNNRVRRVDGVTQIITTIAGTGVAGYNGDSISSINASLNNPRALTLDPAGALYVGDTNNFRIRRLDPKGFITTYAGNGVNQSPQTSLTGPIGIVNALTTDTVGKLYMAESTTSALWTLVSSTNTVSPLSALSTPAYLGDAGPLSNAYFNRPMGLIVDTCGNLLIADSGNYRLRRTYTFGTPLNPLYINMNFTYTNYFASTGTTYISINGNPLTTFTGSSESNQSFSLTDANLLNYPLQGSNPVYGNQRPYIVIQQTSTFGYTKLMGTLWVNEIPRQGLLNDIVDSNSGIIMNSGTVLFPYQNNGITIQNPYNDASLRSVNYTGSLISASDPALKEHVEPANLSICYTTLNSLPLQRYTYVEPYISTFHVADRHRLGFLTSEVASVLPKSISPMSLEYEWAPSSINTLDMTQIKYIHLGVTKNLIKLVDELEGEISTVTSLLAQRNNVH